MKRLLAKTVLLFLIPTIVIAADPVAEMKALRDGFRKDYENYRTTQYKTAIQEHYIKMLHDVSNVSQVILIKIQKKYQEYTQLYNEWQAIKANATMSIEEKALYMASIKTSMDTLALQAQNLQVQAQRLEKLSNNMCEAENVKDVALRYDPEAYFKVPRYHFSPDAPPQFESSFYVEVSMNTAGGDVHIPMGTTQLGSINDPKLSEDQQAATAIGAAVVSAVICGGTSFFTAGAASAFTCSPAAMAAYFAATAFLLNGIFNLANQYNAINEYSDKMKELKGYYDDTNDHIDVVHAKLNIDYQSKFDQVCQEVFLKREADEVTIKDYMASVVLHTQNANEQIKSGREKYSSAFETFKNDYAQWLDSEINVLSKLQSKLDVMFSSSLTQYFANLLAIDNEARNYFISSLLPQLNKVNAINDTKTAAWVNQADNLLEKQIEGDLRFDASKNFHALPWKGFQQMVKQKIGGEL